MTTFETSLQSACEAVPGVVSGALVLVPEGLLIGGIGDGGDSEREPLVRAATRLAAARAPLLASGSASPFAEYAFVADEQVVVILRGHSEPRVVLVLACNRGSNLALVLGAARRALSALEANVDLSLWEA